MLLVLVSTRIHANIDDCHRFCLAPHCNQYSTTGMSTLHRRMRVSDLRGQCGAGDNFFTKMNLRRTIYKSFIHGHQDNDSTKNRAYEKVR